jgi:hypothetical protein
MAQKLTREERIEAEIIAAHMLVSRVRPLDVNKALREKFGCSYQVARSIIEKIRREQQEEAVATREEVRRRAHQTLDEAISVAFKRGDVRAVVHCVKLQSEIAGLIGSEVHLVTQPKEKDDELKGKGEIDLNAQALWGKDFAELSVKERGVLLSVLQEKGDTQLAEEVQSQMN